jgi:glutamyl-tRNA reductase
VTAATGVVQGVRVSHDVTDLDAIREAGASDQSSAVERLLDAPDVSEAFALHTCHRVEEYVVAPDAATGREALDRRFGDDAVAMGHDESLRHLLRVAAGLESVVLGEDQVLGQVRDAHEDARSVGAIGPVLGDAVTKAIRVGERARTETAINEGVVSMGSAAVRLVQRERPVADATTLVVGAGEMGELAATALARVGADPLTVANRTPERAEAVVADLDADVTARATDLDDLPGLLAAADVAVTATASPVPLVDAPTLADAGETLVVDLGQPRDVDPDAAGVEGVTLHDIDDIESVTESTRESRASAAAAVEEMVERELDTLQTQFKRKRADQVIGAMYEGAERVKDRELARAIDRLEADGDLTPEQREVVESLADTLVSQLLAAPTRSLREAAAEDDWETINTAIHLFDPAFEGGPDVGDLPDAVTADDD